MNMIFHRYFLSRAVAQAGVVLCCFHIYFRTIFGNKMQSIQVQVAIWGNAAAERTDTILFCFAYSLQPLDAVCPAPFISPRSTATNLSMFATAKCFFVFH